MRGLANIEPLLGDVATMQLDHSFFDRALLVTVLGEIWAREAALHEIYMALKPGGIVSITEVLPTRIISGKALCGAWPNKLDFASSICRATGTLIRCSSNRILLPFFSLLASYSIKYIGGNPENGYPSKRIADPVWTVKGDNSIRYL